MPTIASILIIGIWIVVVIITASLSRRVWPNQKELSRKIVHIGSGPIIPLALILKIQQETAFVFAAFITICLFINNNWKLIPALEDVNRKSYGTIAYGLSISVLILFFWTECPPAIVAGILVMAFGDGLAGLIGSNIYSPYWKIFGQKKSVLGTLSMLLVSLIILITINIYSGSDINLLGILAIGTIGVICEQFGNWGIDNLTVP